MTYLISCEFNMDTACVELKFNDGSMIAIDTIAVENEVADNMVRVGLADLQCAVGVRRSDTERRSGEVSESGHAV